MRTKRALAFVMALVLSFTTFASDINSITSYAVDKEIVETLPSDEFANAEVNNVDENLPTEAVVAEQAPATEEENLEAVVSEENNDDATVENATAEEDDAEASEEVLEEEVSDADVVAEEEIIEEEEEISDSFEVPAGQYSIVVSPKSAFPEGTEINVGVIKNNLPGFEEGEYVAFDISFLYNGEEIQPDFPVEVSVSDLDLEAEELEIYHMKDLKSEPELVDTVENGEEVSFEAESFSVYVFQNNPNESKQTAISTVFSRAVGKAYSSLQDNDPDEYNVWFGASQNIQNNGNHKVSRVLLTEKADDTLDNIVYDYSKDNIKCYYYSYGDRKFHEIEKFEIKSQKDWNSNYSYSIIAHFKDLSDIRNYTSENYGKFYWIVDKQEKLELTVDSFEMDYTGSSAVIPYTVKAGNTDVTNESTVKWYSDSTCNTEISEMPKNAGDYTLYAKATKSQYGDSDVVRVSVKIKKVNLTVSVDESSRTKTYDGKQINISLTVKNGETIIPEADYNVTWYKKNYNNNYSITTLPTDAGNYVYYAKISGSNFNTTDYVRVGIVINKAKITKFVAPTAISNLTYNGGPQVLITEGSCEEGTIYYYFKDDKNKEQKKSSVDFVYKTNPGEYYVAYEIVPNDSNNYDGISKTEIDNPKPSIAKKHVEPSVTVNDLTYNGAPQKLITYSDPEGAAILEFWIGNEQVFDYPNWSGLCKTNAGTYTVNYKINPKNETKYDYDTDLHSVKVTIAPATAELTLKPYTGDSLTYKNSSIQYWVSCTGIWKGYSNLTDCLKVSCEPENSLDCSIKYEYSLGQYVLTIKPGSEYVESAKVTVSLDTTKDKAKNYTVAPQTIDVKVNKGQLSATTADGFEGDYDGQEHFITVTPGKGDNGVDGNVYYSETEDDKYTKENIGKTNAGEYEIFYKVVSNGYKDATGSALIKINQAAIPNASVSLESWTFGEEANKPSVSPNDYENVITYAKKGSEEFSEKVPALPGEYTVKAVITPEEGGNYKETTVTDDFSINALSVKFVYENAEGEEENFDGSLKEEYYDLALNESFDFATLTKGNVNDFVNAYVDVPDAVSSLTNARFVDVSKANGVITIEVISIATPNLNATGWTYGDNYAADFFEASHFVADFEEGVRYEIKYFDADKKPLSEMPVNAGTYNAKAISAGNESAYYNGIASDFAEFTIAKLPVKIKWSIGQYHGTPVSRDKVTFNGSAYSVTGEVTNAVNGDKLFVSLAGDVKKTDAGSYSATVDKLTKEDKKDVVNENYTTESGENITFNWEILAKYLTNSAVLYLPSNIYYMGVPSTPHVTVKAGYVTLTEGKDYEVVYSDNTQPTKTAKVTVNFKGNYFGKKDATFWIHRFNVNTNFDKNYYVSIDDINPYTYDGSEKKPEVKAVFHYLDGKDEKTMEIPSWMYTLSYENNVNANKAAKVNIEFLNKTISQNGNTFQSCFSGSLSKNFEIKKAQGSIVTEIDPSTFSWANRISKLIYGKNEGKYIVKENTNVKIPTFTYGYRKAKESKIVSAYYKDGKIVLVPGKTEGTEIINVSVAETDNYTAASTTITVSVENGTITATSSEVKVTYDGNPHTIEVTAHRDGNFKYNDKKTITYADSTNGRENLWYSYKKPSFTKAGNYEVSYKVTCPGYKDVIGYTKVIIEPKELKIKWSDPKEFTYDGKKHGVYATFDGVVGEDSVSVKYTDGYVHEAVDASMKANNSDHYTASVLAEVDGRDKDNYVVYQGPQTWTNWTIKQAEVELDWYGQDTYFAFGMNTHNSYFRPNFNFYYSELPYTLTATVKETVTRSGHRSPENVTVTSYSGNVQTDANNKKNKKYTATALELSDANYKLPKNASKDWTISYKPEFEKVNADVRAYNSDAKANKGWFNTSVTIGADGYSIKNVDDINGQYWNRLLREDETYNTVVNYCLKNGEGYVSANKSTSYKIDKTNPAGNIRIGVSSVVTKVLKWFFKDYVVVSVDAWDNGFVQSGVDKVTYKINGGEEKNLPWTILGRNIYLDASQTSELFVTITDVAGNKVTMNSDSIIVYTDATQKTAAVETEKLVVEDKSVLVNTNGNTIKAVSLNGEELVSGNDYVISGNDEIVLKGEYLESLAGRDASDNDVSGADLAKTYTFNVSYNPNGETYDQFRITGWNQTEGDSVGWDADDTTFDVSVYKSYNEVITINNPGKTYDGKAVSTTFTTKSGRNAVSDNDLFVVEYRANNETAEWSTAAPASAGNYQVRVTAKEDANYYQASATLDFTIGVRHVDVWANDASKTEGEADPAFTVSVDNAIEGVTAYAWRIAGNEAPGEYTISITIDGSYPNYDISTHEGTFTIIAGPQPELLLPAVVTPVGPGPVAEIEEVEEETPEVQIPEEETPEVEAPEEEAPEVQIPEEAVPEAAPAQCVSHWFALGIALLYGIYAMVRALQNKKELGGDEKTAEN